jgi:hypothetical protein
MALKLAQFPQRQCTAIEYCSAAASSIVVGTMNPSAAQRIASQGQGWLAGANLIGIVADALDYVPCQFVCRVLPKRRFGVCNADPRPAGSRQESLCNGVLIDSVHAPKHAPMSPQFKSFVLTLFLSNQSAGNMEFFGMCPG